ncbi:MULTISPECIES: shikimate dehydrogenase [Gammaproteobacteria]|uniref:shikimate dehydrogenase n=1 Tax=Gammaproteobacteria TaxID=1236 RepID=UPI001A9D575D|nr:MULTISPECIES: shikimate dehydrogenase [Gammaproteobacteria]
MKFAVFGEPIQHSLSPQIHQQFGLQAGLKLEYLRILTPPKDLKKRFYEFVEQGGSGANFTLPLKELATDLADQVEDVSLQTGATNTLVQRGTQWVATNTDGLGLVSDLLRKFGSLQDKKILMLGAGGAARGVLPALLAQNPRTLHIANRTPERAERLVNDAFRFHQEAPLSAGALTLMPDPDFDLIINATSSGLDQEKPKIKESLLKSKPFCYDMVYGDKQTPFLEWASGRNCEVADGLGMLVGQAAESFRRWTGVMPDVGTVILRVRKQLSQV